jgi:nucleotide-binding universal stress UspA family protein
MEVTKVHFKNILYATDFSENAQYACSYAKSIADQYNAEITLLHVIKEEIPDLLIFDAGMDRSSSAVSDRLTVQKDIFEEQTKNIISKIKNEYGDTQIGIKDIVVVKGNPVKVIVSTAEEKNCDLIIMGVKGRSSIEEMLMGDTVRRVISKGKVPVLVVQNPIKK